MLRELLAAASDRIVIAGEAADGGEALDLAASRSADLFLLDAAMPGMDGLTAAGVLQAMQTPPDVLIVTSGLSDDDLPRARRLGVEVISKLDVGKLLERVSEIEARVASRASRAPRRSTT